MEVNLNLFLCFLADLILYVSLMDYFSKSSSFLSKLTLVSWIVILLNKKYNELNVFRRFRLSDFRINPMEPK